MKRLSLLLMVTACCPVAADWLPPAKYATQYSLYFALEDSNSPHRFYETAPDAADIHVFADGASEAHATNAVTDLGRTFCLVLTVGEMTAKVVTVDVNDASAPPLFKDAVFYIPTFGDPNAYHVFDYSQDLDGKIDANFVTLTAAMDANFALIPTTEQIRAEMDTNSTDLNTLIAYAVEWDPNFTAILGDTNDLQTWWANGGRLDLLIDGIKAITDVMQAVNSTVSGPNDANNFIIANTGDINDVNDAYEGMTVYVKDATTGDWESRLIDTWKTGREITVDYPFTFTPDTGDIVIIWGMSYFPMDVYEALPLPPEQIIHEIDMRPNSSGTATTGGTRTLNAEGDDP